MGTIEQNPHGSDWQAHVAKLCHIQCHLRGETYQPVPDQVEGDGGLEGISTDGEGYQCYSDQNTMNAAERLRKQKKKISEDINKLKKNKEFWAEMFGDKKLRRWFLIAPDVPDKDALLHARRCAKRLRSENLPFIDSNFEAFVTTDERFQQAKEWCVRIGSTVKDFSPDAPVAGEINKLGSQFIANTERKLRQVRPGESDATIHAQRDKYLQLHLDCQNVLTKVLEEMPEVWERVQLFCSQQKRSVEFDSGIDDSKPNLRLSIVRKSLAADLDRDFRMLGKPTLESIALGNIAAWLGECSLEFLGSGKDE